MTLEELKEKIEEAVFEYGKEILDEEVMIAYDYGDVAHTRALADVDALEFLVPEDSAYSPTNLAVPRDYEPHRLEDDEFDDPERRPVFVVM